MKRKVVVLIAVFILVVTAQTVLFGKACDNQSAVCKEKKCYLFSYFKGGGESGVFLAYSYDGLNWTELNGGKAFVKGTVGRPLKRAETNAVRTMRDPCIVRGPDGTFHMVFSAKVRPRGFGYTSSKDLINWTEQKPVRVMQNEPNAINCWAPDTFYDEVKKEYLILWSSTVPGKFPETDGQGPGGHNHRIYYCKTKDFQTFSESKLIYNHGFNVIDATLAKAGNQYIMFLKDETNTPFVPEKNIKMAFSSKTEGPYSSESKPITGKYWCEGPSAIKIAGNWYVYFDKFLEGSYGVVTSKDLENWEDISDKAVFPKGCRHGTVFEVPGDVLNKLLEL